MTTVQLDCHFTHNQLDALYQQEIISQEKRVSLVIVTFDSSLLHFKQVGSTWEECKTQNSTKCDAAQTNAGSTSI